jgi:hypothetical protein
MNKFYTQTLFKLETEIDELEIEADCPIQRIETVIHIIIEFLSELKKNILKSGFKNTEEEIHFFKHQKPVIVSKLIYYNAIL